MLLLIIVLLLLHLLLLFVVKFVILGVFVVVEFYFLFLPTLKKEHSGELITFFI